MDNRCPAVRSITCPQEVSRFGRPKRGNAANSKRNPSTPCEVQPHMNEHGPACKELRELQKFISACLHSVSSLFTVHVARDSRPTTEQRATLSVAPFPRRDNSPSIAAQGLRVALALSYWCAPLLDARCFSWKAMRMPVGKTYSARQGFTELFTTATRCTQFEAGLRRDYLSFRCEAFTEKSSFRIFFRARFRASACFTRRFSPGFK